MTGITLKLVDAYRIDAAFGNRLVAWSVRDNYGWSIHAREPNGDVATVDRVQVDDPFLTRPLVLLKLHKAAVARLDGAA